MNKLTSVHTQIPYDYYSLKFCRPRGGIKRATENLGEFLGGDLIENSPFQLFMEQDQFCKVLCQVDLAKSDVSALKTIIKEEYHNNWIIDNLPAASIVDSEQYWNGVETKTSNLSSSVKSKSIRLIFGRIDCPRRVLEAQQKSVRRNGRICPH